MTSVNEGVDRGSPIDLARERNFPLGGVEVRPSSSEVVANGTVIRLQPRVTQVLVALSRAGGEVVSRDELLSSCWGGLAIGDDAINRCIGRLRRLAEQEAPGSFIIETLPRIGYRLSRSAAALPAAAVSAPPEPIKPFPGPALHRGLLERNPVAIVAGLVVVLALIALWVGFGRPGWPTPLHGVAVAPLASDLAEVPTRRVADAATARLAGSLAKADMKTLFLDSQTLSRLERDAAAVRLGAALVVSGRVERQGETLEVRVDLDDARRHEALWSASLSRPWTEAQSLEDQLAAKVTVVLHCALEAADSTAIRIAAADLSLYLNACDNMVDEYSSPRSQEQFRRLVQREPNFAQAWGGLALIDVSMAEDLPPNQSIETINEARSAAARALQLDPTVGSAYVALADLIPAKRLWNRQMLLQKGLKAAPADAILNHAEGELLGAVGAISEATVYAQRAADLDPWNPFWAAELSQFLAHEGRTREASAVVDQALRIAPSDEFVESVKIGIEARFGDPNVALKLLSDPKSTPQSWTDGIVEDWRQYIKARTSRDPAMIQTYADGLLARLHAGKIDVNRALVRLNSLGATEAAFKAVQSSPLSSLDTETLFRMPPEGQGMWRDPRFMSLAAKSGLIDFWNKSGVWPDFCQGPGRPYDCVAASAQALKTAPKG